jgi:hypothetical protein
MPLSFGTGKSQRMAPSSIIPIDIAASARNINLRTIYDSSVFAPITIPTLVVFTIKSGVIIGSNARTSANYSHYSLRTGSWNANTNLKLVIENGAYVVGMGGSAACGGIGGGGHGGPAILIEHSTGRPFTIVNNGVIGGGGGAGAGAPIGADQYGGAGGAGDPVGTNPGGATSACAQNGCYQNRTGHPGYLTAGGGGYNTGCPGSQRGGSLGQSGFSYGGTPSGGGACGWGLIYLTASYLYSLEGNAINGTCTAALYTNGTGGK